MIRSPYLAAILAVASLSSVAFARINNHFQIVAGDADYQVSPDGTVNVPLYLKQLGVDSPNISLENGLYSVGFAITRSVSVPSSPAYMNSLSANTSDFDVHVVATDYFFSSTSAGLSESRWNTSAVSGPVPDANSLIYIGNVGVTAGSIVGQTTTFNLGDFDLSSVQTVTYGTSPLDSFLTPGSFSVTVVAPEPASLCMLAVGAAALWSRRRR
jgi:hypothetical protein